MPPSSATTATTTTTTTTTARAAEVTRTATAEARTTTTSILHHPWTRTALPFINGGIAGMTATAMIQPIDMIKVRLQLAGEGIATGPKPTPITVTRDILASGRFRDFYTGLSAGLLRQTVYTTARLGLFDTFMAQAKTRAEAKGKTAGFAERAAAGISAGGLAALLGNPADLVLIRMQSDGLKAAAERANYRSVLDALVRISKSEGIAALWSGCLPTVARAMALNFGQLAFFSEAKTQLKTRTAWSSQAQTLTASAIAGFFASFFSLPFDFVKTRLQKQTRRPDGTLPYRGMLHCAKKVIAEEGWGRFYRGFSTYYVRVAPHA